MSTWRMAGLNYVNYSNIAAKVLRMSLKADLKAEASRRDESTITVNFWSEGIQIGFGTAPLLCEEGTTIFKLYEKSRSCLDTIIKRALEALSIGPPANYATNSDTSVSRKRWITSQEVIEILANVFLGYNTNRRIN